MKKRLLQNKNGSALVWAVCISLVISVILAACLAMAMNTHNRFAELAASENNRLLCRSALETAAAEISSHGDSSLLICDSTVEATVTFEGSKVALICERTDANKLTLTARCDKETLSLVVRKNSEGWEKERYLS